MERRNLRSVGAVGEELAVRHLTDNGYDIVERNFRFGKNGEIDIVAREGDYLVFCEVKMRTNDKFGPPEYAITRQKQRTIRRAAQAYLLFKGIQDQACRFDVVTIRSEGETPVFTLIKNAF